MFRTIANLDLYKDFTAEDMAQVTSTLESDTPESLPERFSQLSIALDDNPNLIRAPDDTSMKCADRSTLGGYMRYLPRIYGNWGVMSMCRQTFDGRWSLPDIETPPAWALDSNGQPEAGFGCKGLLGRDTSYMASPGAFLLHELFHWPYLFEDVPEYSTLVPEFKSQGFSKVLDFAGPDPPNGYGKSAFSPRSTVQHYYTPFTAFSMMLCCLLGSGTDHVYLL